MKNETENPENSEKPEEIIDDIASSLDELHKRFVETSANIGYARDAILAVRPTWERLGNSVTSDPDALNLYDTNFQFLKSFRDEVHSYQEMATPLIGLFNNTAGTASTFVSASGSTDAFLGSTTEYSPSDFPVFLTPNQHEIYAKRFMAFDESLGKTYQEIWEVLYGTRADPERAALYLIRQSFDHLFGKLAPDDEVRKSPFWTLKDGKEPEQVWREERVQYAASTHIKDKARSETISASSRHMLNVYQALNRAHERKNINRAKARKALEEMRTFLEDWANAVGL
jgi:hypothetical protein